MTSYKELLEQRKSLDAKIQDARNSELADATAKARALVAEYGLTSEDVFGRAKAASSRAGTKVAPKYRNPSTGETWTGRGKPPKWIADVNREEYLIAA
ncbi:H-NS histone family protein [Acidovorax sp.]|uniref:H-NS histone family protein n=1 Tax=Acidovorax sp. TaxID=1872122 RepID=UPI0027B97D81|nr:H-NS histone family protein [Acidovorax sp.]